MYHSFVIFILLTVLTSSCGILNSAKTSSLDAPSLPPPAPIAADDAANETTIRFLENKLKQDPEDFGANNKLAGLYLQKLRETGNSQFLELATRAARASLASVPEVRNAGGLAALALAEFASHDFVSAKEHAFSLTKLEPQKSYPQGILGDVLLELGEYEQAELAYQKIVVLDGGISHNSETRLARLSNIKGDPVNAQKRLVSALTLALNLPVPPRETIAWIRWQLGETAFSVGDYKTAEKYCAEALVTFPDYYRAVASMGKVRAAQNDSNGAVENYEKVVRLLPDPQFIAALGDLYALAGREEDARKQYELVEQIGHLSELNGALYNRQLALFDADHDLKPEEAYKLAAGEYEMRRDIYGADAVAWTALKAGKLNEAQAAMKEAMRLGTSDAKLFYHAGMIEKALGEKAEAIQNLQRALQINPMFDPLQAEKARVALQELK